MIRQGDILIIVGEKRRLTGHLGPVTVGHGENGHTHTLAEAKVADGDALAMELFARGHREAGAQRVSPPVFVPDDGTTLEHGEHAGLITPGGEITVIRQREYTPRSQPTFTGD